MGIIQKKGWNVGVKYGWKGGVDIEKWSVYSVKTLVKRDSTIWIIK